MAIQEVLPAADTGREMEENSSVQAGRTPSSLEAERNAAEIQSGATTPDLGFSSNSPPLLPLLASSSPPLSRAVSNASLRRLSYAPTVPSPLNPSKTNSSLSSNEAELAATDSSSPIDSSSSSNLPGDSSMVSLQTQESIAPKRHRSARNALQDRLHPRIAAHLRRSETPKHIQDLGRDYSRYPSSTSLNSNSKPTSQSRLLSSKPAAPLLRTTTQNPFSDSQADLHMWGFPDDSIGVFDPYYGGEKGFILYTDEIEADDELHTPGPDDDTNDRPKLSDYNDRRTLVSAVGGVFLVLGLICVFIILPVLTFTTTIYGNVESDPNYIDYGPAWAHVNNESYALLKNVRKGLIDPDTPARAYNRTSTFDGSTLSLVFSDEFNVDGRTFYPGDDPYWTAPDIWYGATQDLEWYSPAAATTGNGTLQLTLSNYPNHNLQYQSGMLNSWNQLCFKGGVMEVSVSLAGPSGVPGLWPGIWTMGNLGRPGYKATTEGVWPYTYNSCDYGITPNQSDSSGISFLPGQKLSACSCSNEDHPNPGTGRGAPELDVLEASVDPNNRIGVVTQSAQIAPFDIWYRPNSEFMQIPNYETTQMNVYCGGPYQQAVSGTTLLNNEWYDGNAYQKYAFEYIPGESTGKIAWFVGDEQTFMLDGRAIGPNGNVGARQISEEPMSMVLNLGFSNSWTQIFLDGLKFPTVMNIDYVRIYQRPGYESITCDPPGYPTTDYIAAHPEPYKNPNLTAWNETGYSWPKNTLTGC
ncbi:hypothetical protein BP5796_01388 [Coleophoma crateriformis]|uniref:GH16 domain-containing protein n=1 Tax=Coleophoma crateriformis TaxID=565419 RepID=A0A3D8T0C8_9HELO|nr:hypothetical protein BP5796_01388 [Coleophoma crateriformis]